MKIYLLLFMVLALLFSVFGNLFAASTKEPVLKVMPDTAFEKALEALGEVENAQIELKQVQAADINDKEKENGFIYQVKADKKVKLFGLFKFKIPLTAQIDTQTGLVIKTQKPWWSFLAR